MDDSTPKMKFYYVVFYRHTDSTYLSVDFKSDANNNEALIKAAQKSKARIESEKELTGLLEAKRATEKIHKIDLSSKEDVEGWDEY